jgi:hypothetical protein
VQTYTGKQRKFTFKANCVCKVRIAVSEYFTFWGCGDFSRERLPVALRDGLLDRRIVWTRLERKKERKERKKERKKERRKERKKERCLYVQHDTQQDRTISNTVPIPVAARSKA